MKIITSDIVWWFCCASACVVHIVAGQARCLRAKPLWKLFTCRTKCSSMQWIVQHLRIKSTKICRYVSTVKLCAWLVSWLVVWLVGWLWTSECWYIAFFFQDIARYIKEEFNKKYDRYWHCIVGPNFACSVNHDTERYISFDMGEDEIVLFKIG